MRPACWRHFCGRGPAGVQLAAGVPATTGLRRAQTGANARRPPKPEALPENWSGLVGPHPGARALKTCANEPFNGTTGLVGRAGPQFSHLKC